MEAATKPEGLTNGSKIELKDCVIAIVDGDKAAEAVQRLGREVVRLEGEEDREKLLPRQEGLLGGLSKLAAAFGDELRIIDEIDRALATGDAALIVQVGPDQGPEVVQQLQDLGAKSVWEFRDWIWIESGAAEGSPADQ